MEKDKETKATEEREGSQVNQNVVDFGSAMTKTAHGTVYTLAIIGQIEGHTAAPNGTKTTQYEHMLPLLAKLEESREVDGILFLLNTVGGDVEAGLAIAELVAGMKKPTVSLVLGGGHSIGVYDPATQNKEKVYKMMHDKRIRYYAPADYTELSELDLLVKAIIDKTAANEILEDRHFRNIAEAKEHEK